MERWLEATALDSTPEAHGYDPVLGTLNILVDLLKNRFWMAISAATVASHVHRLQPSCQTSVYRAFGQDPERVNCYLKEKFPKIQKSAEQLGADIGFEDESWIGASQRSGRTGGRPMALRRGIDKRTDIELLVVAIPSPAANPCDITVGPKVCRRLLLRVPP